MTLQGWNKVDAFSKHLIVGFVLNFLFLNILRTIYKDLIFLLGHSYTHNKALLEELMATFHLFNIELDYELCIIC